MPARIPVFKAWLDGWRRVLRAPVLIVGLLALTLLHSVLPAESRFELLSYVSGRVDTEDGDRARDDAQRLTAETFGLGWIVVYPTFGLGRAGGELAGFLMPFAFPPVVVSPPIVPVLHTVAGNVMSAVILLFLSGGVIDRLARGRPVRAHAFFSACGEHLFRFLRLGVPLGLLYWLFLRWIYPWLIGPLFVRLAGGTSAQTIEVIRFTIDSVVMLILVVTSVIGDYALVRTVVEDRRSALGSLAAGARFVRQRLLRVLGLYTLTAILPMAVFVALSRLLPLGALPEPLMFAIFGIVTLFIQLTYVASATAFFQGELAHAQYTAAPAPVWPESPAAEAIRNLKGE